MRFRNPQISTTNRFEAETGQIGDVLIVFPQDEILGRLDIDGMVVGLGVMVEFR
jgi:hypothetical protein